MERNDSTQNDANEFSGSGSTRPDGEGNFEFAESTPTEAKSGTIKDRAMNVASGAGEKLADLGTSLRERAGATKDKLAGALESGAERLREKAHVGVGALTAAGTEGATSIPTDGKVAQISDKVAGGMEATAEWLRDADLESVKLGIERQVKEHPARTLLIAAGLGYLIGRAFRGGNSGNQA